MSREQVTDTPANRTVAGTYWAVRLSDCPAGTLPLDHPRTGVQTFTRDELSHRLPRLVEAVEAGTSDLAALAAAVMLVLLKYSGRTGVTLGALVDTGEEGSAAGHQVLPLSLNLDAQSPVKTLPRLLDEALLEARDHLGAELESFIDSRAGSDPAQAAPYHVVLAVEDRAGAAGSLDDALDACWEAVQSSDIVIRASVEGESLRLDIDYDVDVLEASTVRAFFGHLDVALAALSGASDTPLAEVSVLTPGERRRLLYEWSDTRVAYPPLLNLHALFERRAADDPDAVALLWQDQVLSYTELNRRANRLAHWIRDQESAHGTPVAVFMERSPEMVVALYAVLKSGRPYLPIDPEYPQDRVAFMLTDSRADMVLTHSRHAPDLPEAALTILSLDSEDSVLAAHGCDNPPPLAGPDDVAYVMYTSGSTGTPKGVLNNHRGICNRLQWMQSEFRLDSVDTVLQKTPFTFDVSVWEFFWPLMYGARLAVLPPGHHRDAASLLAHLERHEVTTLHFVPSMLQLFLDEPSLRGCERLKRVFCSGEVLPVSLQERFFQRLPEVELHNLYGPTEAAIDVSHWRCQPGERRDSVPIGRPVANTQLYILDGSMQPLPVGVPGELYIGGVQVARGYLNRPELTTRKFVPDPFRGDPGGRLYRTGDLARFLPDGNIEFLGRIDHQVKLRGLRIELGEIEEQMARCEGVREAVVQLREDTPGDQRLVAYVVGKAGNQLDTAAIEAHLRRVLPTFMVPHPLVELDAMPLNPSGKVDRSRLPPPAPKQRACAADLRSRSDTEQAIAAIWAEFLGLEQVGLRDNFFDLGGHSVLVARVRLRLQKLFDSDISMSEMFRYTTVESLARRIEAGAASRKKGAVARRSTVAGDVAVVGLACRLPGARTADEFWYKLENGVESVTFFSDEELLEAGVAAAELENPYYVRARAVLEDADLFDAEFFGYSPREAELIDPQQRIFLEAAWHALEDAGYAREDRDCTVGVYAGAGMNTYMANNLRLRASESGAVGAFQVMISNDKDFLPTRVSYKLNLKGPSVNVQTACSTSLVAIHTACRALIEGECDMALAGGVTVHLPQVSGYEYTEGMILSSDGHCRAFDSRADGTVFGSGVAVLVLKPLERARSDGDQIHAVIKGSAINNDGSQKIGYTAPSVEGQSEVIRAAHAQAGVTPDTISYVEAHGTGTSLGDPIEVEALTEAFRGQTDARGFCGIGSLKTNIGHVDAAAGAAGAIKTILSLKNRRLPPSLHFESPNPGIDFARSPFYVVRESTEWTAAASPRRAGVSSFGIGGTNAHIVLEEATEPAAARPERDRSCHLLTLSARTLPALRELAAACAGRLANASGAEVGDICFTANATRERFAQRLAVVGANGPELASALSTFAEEGSDTAVSEGSGDETGSIAFLMTGQGSQQAGMGSELYRESPVFRRELDRCAAILDQYLDVPLLQVMQTGEDTQGASLLHDTRYTQPALFAYEYALARLWMSWGVRPELLIGHSVGEYVAACLAGVFGLEDGLKLIAHRGRLMSALPQNGEMLAVLASRQDVANSLGPYAERVSLAAINGPASCVISGERSAVRDLQVIFSEAGVEVRPLNVSHAFHSPLMEPMLSEFREIARGVAFASPEVGLISNVSGSPAGDEVTDPEYWVRHIREPVNFLDGIRSLESAGCRLFLECGPQPVLAGMGRACAEDADLEWFPSRRHGAGEWAQILGSLGRLAVRGVTPDWSAFDEPYSRRRVSLPGYPFQRERFWVEESPESRRAQAPGHVLLGQRLSLPMSSEARFEKLFAIDTPAYVRDHRIFGVLVVAGASHCSLLLQGASEVLGGQDCTLEEIYFLQPFVLSEEGQRQAQLIIGAPCDGVRQMQLISLVEGGDPLESEHWTQHLRAQLALGSAGEVPGRSLELAAIRARCHRKMGHDAFYGEFWVQGPDAGPSFRWIETIWMGSDEALACTSAPDTVEDPGDFLLYPGVIEACFQVLRGCREFESQSLLKSGGFIYVPFGISRFRLLQKPSAGRLWCYARLRDDTSEQRVIGDLLLADESGAVIGLIDGFECRRLPRETLLHHIHSNTRDWIYQTSWACLELRPDTAAAGEQRWLILDDGTGLGEALASELEAAGHVAIRVRSGDRFAVDGNGDYQMNPGDPGDFARLLESVGRSLGRQAGADPVHGIINLWGLSAQHGGDLEKRLWLGGASTLHLTQALVGRSWNRSPALWLVSRGSQPVGDEPMGDASEGPLWGFARVLVQEHPEVRARCADLSATDPAADVVLLAREIQADDAEDQVAFRQGRRYVSRLVRYRAQDGRASPVTGIRPDATYLVTGWSGGIGLRIVQWLAAKGAGHLLLPSRKQPAEDATRVLDSLRASGVEAQVVIADVSDAAAVDGLFRQASARLPPVAGVIHAAGALDDGMLTQQSWERFLTVYGPKVLGTWHLHRHTLDLPLDFFICFSSATALLGAPGQGNYAAANAFMDSLMAWRRSAGLAGLSISWGPWGEIGMAAALGEREQKRSRDQGWGRIDPATGLNILDDLLHCPMARIAVLPLQWGKFSESLFDGQLPPFLGIWQPRSRETDDRQSTPSAAGEAVLSAPPQHREEELRAYVVRVVADLLGHRDIDTRQGFMEMGMDSLMGVDLRATLQKTLHVSLPSTFAFDHSNVDAVVSYLMAALFPADETAAADSASAEVSRIDLDEVEIDTSIETELAALEQELERGKD